MAAVVNTVAVAVPPIDLTSKTQQVREFFTQQHEEEKDYLKRMLANVPPNVPAWAVDAVRNKLADMENKGPPVADVQPIKKTTVKDLMAVTDDDLDKMAARFSAHARNKLKPR